MLLLALAAPANGAIELQGLHAYPDRESVPAPIPSWRNCCATCWTTSPEWPR